MIIKNLTNRFFRKPDKESPKEVEEKNLQEVLLDMNSSSRKETEEPKITEEKNKNYKYRITSPNNFKPVRHMKHGSSMLCNKIPDWARNNTRVVIEKLN